MAEPGRRLSGTRRAAAQGLLCGVLQVIVQRLSEADTNKAAVLQYADAMMEARPGAPLSSVA